MRLLGLPFLIVLTSAVYAQPSAPRVRIVEELRLDANAEDFPSVGRIYVGPRGQIVVPITADGQLRVYDATGKKLATVGRRGAGPGEFTSFATVGWIGDTMWAGDGQQRRTVFVGPDYKHLRTEAWLQPKYGPGGAVGFSIPVVHLPGGAAVLQGFDPSSSERRALVHRSAEGRDRLILLLWSSDPERMIQVSGWGFGVPFSLQPQYSFAPNGLHVAELTARIPTQQDGTFKVTLISISGDTLFSREYPYRGVPIPRRVADSAIAKLGPTPGHAINVPPDLNERVQAIARERVPRWYIPSESITSGLDQTTWIGMRPTDEGRGYLILNGRGDPIGSLVVPTSTRIRQASATHIWVTETDDDGLSSVVRYRAVGLNCGRGGC